MSKIVTGAATLVTVPMLMYKGLPGGLRPLTARLLSLPPGVDSVGA